MDNNEDNLVFNKNFIFTPSENIPITNINNNNFILPDNTLLFTNKRKHRTSVEEKVSKLKKSKREKETPDEQCRLVDDVITNDSTDNDSVDNDQLTDDAQVVNSPDENDHHIETFAEMNLSRVLLRSLTQSGYSFPTPIQSKAIPVGLQGRDICACAVTGSGKTIAFLLPLLERFLQKATNISNSTIKALVLSPTRELALQIYNVALTLIQFASHIKITLIVGGMDMQQQHLSLKKRPDLIIATPGRLIDHIHNSHSFNIENIEYLVLDEADKMLDENFEDELAEIIKLSPRYRQTLLFSATLTDKVEELARLSLDKPVKIFVDGNTDVAYNLIQEFIRIRPSHEQDRVAIIVALCKHTFKKRCLLFFPTKQMAHRIHVIFTLLGMNAAELHSNLTQVQRLDSLNKFKSGEVEFLLATDLAARGLDIFGVKTVINYSMSATHKQYIHRVGRTARAGKSGRSVTLVGENGRKVLTEILKMTNNALHRIVDVYLVGKYKTKIEQAEDDINLVLSEELEEKEMKLGEMEVKKAENLVLHRDEILSRPAKIWFKTNSKKKKSNTKVKTSKILSSNMKEQIQQKLAAKIARKKSRPKRYRVFSDQNKTNNYNKLSENQKSKNINPKKKNIKPIKKMKSDKSYSKTNINNKKNKLNSKNKRQEVKSRKSFKWKTKKRK